MVLLVVALLGLLVVALPPVDRLGWAAIALRVRRREPLPVKTVVVVPLRVMTLAK
jgi:hypothetical protein